MHQYLCVMQGCTISIDSTTTFGKDGPGSYLQSPDLCHSSSSDDLPSRRISPWFKSSHSRCIRQQDISEREREAPRTVSFANGSYKMWTTSWIPPSTTVPSQDSPSQDTRCPLIGSPMKTHFMRRTRRSLCYTPSTWPKECFKIFGCKEKLQEEKGDEEEMEDIEWTRQYLAKIVQEFVWNPRAFVALGLRTLWDTSPEEPLFPRLSIYAKFSVAKAKY